MINAAHRDQHFARRGRHRPWRARPRVLARAAPAVPTGSLSSSTPQLGSSSFRPAGRTTTTSFPAAASARHKAVSAGSGAVLPAAVSAQQCCDAVPTCSPTLSAAPVPRSVSVSLPAPAAASSEDDDDVLMRPMADAAAVVFPIRLPHAPLVTAAAAVAAVVSDAAAVDVHTERVVASAMPTDAALMSPDADAALLLGQPDCKEAASAPLVPTGAQSAADSDDRHVSVMIDVDTDCCSVEAQAGGQRRRCVGTELRSMETAAVCVDAAAAIMAQRSRWRLGGGRFKLPLSAEPE
jgi:hypothetical protein